MGPNLPHKVQVADENIGVEDNEKLLLLLTKVMMMMMIRTWRCHTRHKYLIHIKAHARLCISCTPIYPGQILLSEMMAPLSDGPTSMLVSFP